MNSISSHPSAFLPGAQAAAGFRPVAQTESQTPSTTATGEPTPTNGKPSQEAQRELRLQAQLRVKQAQEQRLIDDQIQTLAARDREVRAHEQAHVAAGGQYAGAPVYQYERGPNGVNYAVGGEVSISTGEEPTPEATLRKAQIIRRAALAPAEPSPQDRRVAAMATRMETSARAQISLENTREDDPAAETEKADPGSSPPKTEPSDRVSPSERQQQEIDRLQRKLFTHDKITQSPPGTLFSRMA